MFFKDVGGAGARLSFAIRFRVGILLQNHRFRRSVDWRCLRFRANMLFADIQGNESAKRALQIAAAGGHGALLIGAPHSDAAALAARIPTILPPLTTDDA